MLTQHRQPLVERNECFASAAGLGIVGAEEFPYQGADKLRTRLRSRPGNNGVLKPLSIPAALQFAPPTASAQAFTQRGKERGVPHAVAQCLGVAEQSLG